MALNCKTLHLNFKTFQEETSALLLGPNLLQILHFFLSPNAGHTTVQLCLQFLFLNAVADSVNSFKLSMTR